MMLPQHIGHVLKEAREAFCVSWRPHIENPSNFMIFCDNGHRVFLQRQRAEADVGDVGKEIDATPFGLGSDSQQRRRGKMASNGGASVGRKVRQAWRGSSGGTLRRRKSGGHAAA